MRVALVTPWFGRELIGGAERHAWELTHALAAAGATVDVLATCCRSFHDDWATNFHRPGATRLAERLRLIRFRVDSRDRVAFNRVTAALTALPASTLRGDFVPLDRRDARTFAGENINSRELREHLRRDADSYDAVLFMPYLYGTTLNVLPDVAGKAYLIPCLHDEAYAYLDPVRECFARARGILFNSRGEEETAAAIYGPGIYAKSHVAGEAVEKISAPRSPLTIRGFTPHRARYVLYLGRQVATKNIDFLIAAYELFRQRRASTSLQLVLAGPTNATRTDDGIVDLGPVTEHAKAALLTHARALVQPSLHESFSRAVYESWHVRRPVVVHGACAATVRAVEASGGGWIASTIDEWAQRFAEIDESADDAIDAAGACGWAAAMENGSWDVVARRVIAAIAPPDAPSRTAIDQAVTLGDRASSTYAVALRAALIASGHQSDVIVSEAGSAPTSSLLVAHLSSESGDPIAADAYVVHDGEVVPDAAAAPIFTTSSAVAERLAARGVRSKRLGLPLSPQPWDGLRVAHSRWADERATLLSLAQLDASDVRRLVDVFVDFAGTRRSARLLMFASDCSAEALEIVTRERAELELVEELIVVDDTPAERYTAFRSASVALALGYRVMEERVLTAHWFDVPVFGLATVEGSVSVEAAGIVETAFAVDRFAALLRIVTDDRALRAALVEEGRREARRHEPATIVRALIEGIAAGRAARGADRMPPSRDRGASVD